MAGLYQKTIKELIVQSRLNNQLLNEINNNFDANITDCKNIRDSHLKRVNDAYRKLQLNQVYDYFDGTNFLNSLFSQLVIPIEFLKGKIDYVKTSDAYKKCEGIISHLFYIENLRSTYQDLLCYKKGFNVYSFFKHIKNALSHAGQGNIVFASSQGKDTDITFIYFYDELIPDVGRQSVFLAKIDLNTLFDLIDYLIEMVLSLPDNVLNNSYSNKKYINSQFLNLTGKGIDDFRDAE